MKQELVERLARLDSCALSDALDRLRQSGVVLGLQALTVPRRIAGRVITLQLEKAAGRPSTRHLGPLRSSPQDLAMSSLSLMQAASTLRAGVGCFLLGL